MKGRNTEEFIEYAKSIRTDLDFDYSKVVYKNNRTKIIIIDPVYGEFLIKPNNFTDQNQGHPERGIVKRKITRTISTEEFIYKAKRKITNIDYDYSKVVYVHNRTEVCIIDPIYGDFFVTPNSFLKGSVHFKRNKTRLKTTEEFIIDAKNIHTNIDYDYSKVEYTGNKKKVLIIDPIHGEFCIKPNNFLYGECHPARSNRNQLYSYINLIVYGESTIAIKYGIESFIGNRRREQNRTCIYEVQKHKNYKFSTVLDCRNVEMPNVNVKNY